MISDEDEEEDMDDADKERVIRDGKTAIEFFEILWGANEDEEIKQALKYALENDDIECASFYRTCLKKARQQLRSANALDGYTEYSAVTDADLEEKRKEADRLWPLVKSVQLRTGHRLLRNNICVLDLPGEVTELLL